MSLFEKIINSFYYYIKDIQEMSYYYVDDKNVQYKNIECMDIKVDDINEINNKDKINAIDKIDNNKDDLNNKLNEILIL